MNNSSGISWNTYPKENLKKTMSKHNHSLKIIHSFFMEVWYNTLDIPNLNGNSENFVNQFSKFYGKLMISNLHSMVFVLWMEEEIIDQEKMMHSYMLINPQQKISYGVIKELCASLDQNKIKEDLFVCLKVINSM